MDPVTHSEWEFNEVVVRVETLAVAVRSRAKRRLLRSMRHGDDHDARVVVHWLARAVVRRGLPVAGPPTITFVQEFDAVRFIAHTPVYADAPLWLRQQLLRNPVMAPPNAIAVSFPVPQDHAVAT